MTVAAGIYCLTIEEALVDTLAASFEAEDNYIGLVTDTHTPDFDLDQFVDDIDNEIAGGNYAREDLITTELTIAAGVLKFDAADTVFDNGGSDDVTITNAEAGFHGFNIGSDATDHLGFMSDFGSAFSCTNSTFTIQWHTNGIYTIDLVP